MPMPNPMPTATEAPTSTTWWRRLGPECVLALLAGLVFLGCLGSVDLWGKREQRASAEAIDTIDQNHWLVARIQGRPRLEKPPIPRWTIAALMTLTGRRDEWMVRLPSALSALGMVGLAYALGCRLGGRSVGLASGLALTSMGFFVSEMRQAGNDGLLAFFTTLALYAAWRRLHGEGTEVRDDAADGRGWSLLMYGAMGLGFLCKGPICVVLAAVTLVPYLACARKLRTGLRLLADGWGLLLFVVLAASWPVPVLVNDPNAVRVWMLEMGQKAGTAGIAHHRYRMPLAADWPWMTLPWAVIATMGAVLPLLNRRGAEYRPRVWFVWWWAVGNLAMFCLWSVAKPNYFIPCLPAAAVLAGLEWVRLTRAARLAGRPGAVARRVLQAHWVVIFAGALAAPVVVYQRLPGWLAWSGAFAVVVAAAAVASAWAWRRGKDAGSLAPLTAAWASLVLVGYGLIAPSFDDVRSHRALAEALDRVLPADARTVMFFHELDEGLWFYLRDRALVPVPGSQPAYNDAFRLVEEQRQNRLEWDPDKRVEAQQKIFLDWLRRPERDLASPYVLIRREKFERFAPALAGLVEPVHREHDLKRNELVLLRLTTPAPTANDPPTHSIAGPTAADATRRQ
jgi:4-amino-4-deoxy-L-arabinose transferase-like glycosyltransferase